MNARLLLFLTLIGVFYAPIFVVLQMIPVLLIVTAFG